MSVYHCPLCPLIFQYRSEVEWHLREEHRSRADEAAELRSELADATRPLDWERLSHLRASHASPSVSLLLGTAPAATMTVLDVARLRQLAERARRRLSSEPHRDTAVSVVEHRLSKAVAAAESQPTDRGIAVMVNEHHLSIIALPFAPHDRQVVDGAFATRDLEYALRRYPRYRVLVLGHHPRVLEGHARQLIEPATSTSADPDVMVSERIEATGMLPLVVVGDRRSVDRFRGQSRHAHNVVAGVAQHRFYKGNLTERIADVLEGIQHERQSRAVAELLHADMQSQIDWGVEAAWKAVHDRTADRLWVEHDYAVAGQVRPGTYGIETVTDPAEPGAIDDVVDALLTKATQLGIRTHLLDRHTLGRPQPVAVKVPVTASSQGLTPRAPTLVARAG